MPGDCRRQIWSEGLKVNRKAILLAGVFGALAFAPAAMAENTGWYGAFDLGYHSPDGIETTSTGNAPDGNPYNFTIQSEDKVLGFARLGYRVNPNWRFELELGARPGNVETIREPTTRPLPNEVCSVTL